MRAPVHTPPLKWRTAGGANGARAGGQAYAQRTMKGNVARALGATLASALLAVGAGTLIAAAPAGATSPCSTSKLKLSFRHVPGSDAAGSTIYALRVTNHGSSSCVLGRPTLKLY